MVKNNEVIKERLRKNKLKQWELADRLGMSETTLCVKLRRPVSEEMFNEVNEIIDSMLPEKKKE